MCAMLLDEENHQVHPFDCFGNKPG